MLSSRTQFDHAPLVARLRDCFSDRPLPFQELQKLAFMPEKSLFPKNNCGQFVPLSPSEMMAVCQPFLDLNNTKRGSLSVTNPADTFRSVFALPMVWVVGIASLVNHQAIQDCSRTLFITVARDGLYQGMADYYFEKKPAAAFSTVYLAGNDNNLFSGQGQFVERTRAFYRGVLEATSQQQDLDQRRKEICDRFIGGFFNNEGLNQDGLRDCFLNALLPQIRAQPLDGIERVVIYDAWSSGKSPLLVAAALYAARRDIKSEILLGSSNYIGPGSTGYQPHCYPSVLDSINLNPKAFWEPDPPVVFDKMAQEGLPMFRILINSNCLNYIAATLLAYNRSIFLGQPNALLATREYFRRLEIRDFTKVRDLLFPPFQTGSGGFVARETKQSDFIKRMEGGGRVVGEFSQDEMDELVLPWSRQLLTRDEGLASEMIDRAARNAGCYALTLCKLHQGSWADFFDCFVSELTWQIQIAETEKIFLDPALIGKKVHFSTANIFSGKPEGYDRYFRGVRPNGLWFEPVGAKGAGKEEPFSSGEIVPGSVKIISEAD